MFCRYCGYPLKDPGTVCPRCGKEQGVLSSTNGYFDILKAGIPGLTMPSVKTENTYEEQHTARNKTCVRRFADRVGTGCKAFRKCIGNRRKRGMFYGTFHLFSDLFGKKGRGR